MTVIDEIHVNDDGTFLEFTVYDRGVIKDCSSALEMTLILEKPDKTTIARTLTFAEGAGVDGVLRYITDETDLDMHSHWRGQIKITFPNGVWRSNIFSMYVSDNLVEPGN